MKAGYAIAILLTLASPAVAQQTQAQPQREGRYQIVFSPRVERDTFLLDTATGRVWQLTDFTYLNGDPTVWNAMPRIDTDKDRRDLVLDYGRKADNPSSGTPPKPQP